MEVSVFVGVSVDGFLARKNGQSDFLSPAGDVAHGFEEFYASIDALVMGRNAFETMQPDGRDKEHSCSQT